VYVLSSRYFHPALENNGSPDKIEETYCQDEPLPIRESMFSGSRKDPETNFRAAAGK
jgi:hypothetical protein